jgi:hyperosmotically inducible protein
MRGAVTLPSTARGKALEEDIIMKNKMTILASLAALCLLGAGARAEEDPSDAAISTKVKAELAAHESVSGVRTHVETNKGVVTLVGNARTTAEKELAERYASDVDGVREVDNQITVAGDKTAESAEPAPAGEPSKGARAKDRGAGSRMLDKMGDKSVSSRVKAALEGEPGTSGLHTSVETSDGIVTLYGKANSEAEKNLAERLAKEVKGVKSVDNQITVQSSEK